VIIFKNFPNLTYLWYELSTKRRFQFWCLLITMLIASVAEAISVGSVIPFLYLLTSQDPLKLPYLGKVVHYLGVNDPQQVFLIITILFSLLILISGFMRFTLVFFQSRFSQAIGADLSSAIYKRTLYQQYHIHIATNSSQIISGLSNKVDGVVHHVLMPLLNILSSILMIIAIMLGLLVIDKAITITIFLSFGLIYFIVAMLTKKKLRKNGIEVNEKTGDLIKVIQEGLGGIRDIIIDGTQSIFSNQFDRVDRQMRRASANIQIISASPRFIVESISIIAIAYTAYAWRSVDTPLSTMIPTLGAFLFGAQRLLPICQQVYSSWSSIKGADASLQDILSLLAQPLPISTNKAQSAPCVFQNYIALENIYFQYPLADSWIFSNLNLTITKGSRIGIFGQTGSGKTTLMDILMGLLHPNSGSLVVDGVQISCDDYPTSWFPHIAHVPQSIYLTDSTVLENIAFGVPNSEIDFKQVYDICKVVQLDDFINKLPNKYDTSVGERGSKLSGGQRQKIGIARALYKKADFLIFDEATSSLDTKSEESIIESINSLGREFTIIMIAHRLSTLSGCDWVYEIDSGMIKKSGTYDKIILGKNI